MQAARIMADKEAFNAKFKAGLKERLEKELTKEAEPEGVSPELLGTIFDKEAVEKAQRNHHYEWTVENLMPRLMAKDSQVLRGSMTEMHAKVHSDPDLKESFYELADFGRLLYGVVENISSTILDKLLREQHEKGQVPFDVDWAVPVTRKQLTGRNMSLAPCWCQMHVDMKLKCIGEMVGGEAVVEEFKAREKKGNEEQYEKMTASLPLLVLALGRVDEVRARREREGRDERDERDEREEREEREKEKAEAEKAEKQKAKKNRKKANKERNRAARARKAEAEIENQVMQAG